MFAVESRERYYELVRYIQSLSKLVKLNLNSLQVESGREIVSELNSSNIDLYRQFGSGPSINESLPHLDADSKSQSFNLTSASTCSDDNSGLDECVTDNGDKVAPKSRKKSLGVPPSELLDEYQLYVFIHLFHS